MAKQPESQTARHSFDMPVWFLVAFLVIGALVANQYYQQVAVALRLVAWIILGCVVVGLTLLTAKGQAWKAFFNEARIEMRKVVWPTRQTTVQMTTMVVVLVIIMALVLWLMDIIFIKVIQLLTLGLGV